MSGPYILRNVICHISRTDILRDTDSRLQNTIWRADGQLSNLQSETVNEKEKHLEGGFLFCMELEWEELVICLKWHMFESLSCEDWKYHFFIYLLKIQ